MAKASDAAKQHLADILYIKPELNMRANCYILRFNEISVLIDPSQFFPADDTVKDAAKLLLFATHGHFDHVCEVDRWRDQRSCTLSIHEAEQKLLCDRQLNASAMGPEPCDYRAAEQLFADAERLELTEGYYLESIYTPGHTKGSSCYLLRHDEVEEPLLLFSGDTLFRSSIGRSDLPTGNAERLQESLEKLVKMSENWPEDMPIYPGHGPFTTMAREIKHNPWLI